MVDPSLFTGRYDDGLCAALAARGHDVRLLGRPLRPTDAIRPECYDYRPRFFRAGELARALLGEGVVGRAAKALDYAIDTAIGPTGALAGDVVHFQWLPWPRADARLLDRLQGKAALVHTVHNARAYHDDAGRQGKGYGVLLKRFDALIAHGHWTHDALVAQGLDPARIHVIPHPPMHLAQASEADLAAVPVPHAPRILFFGTIRPYKGLDLLIEACTALWASGLDFELVVAGKPFMPIEDLLARAQAAAGPGRFIADLGFLTEPKLDAHLQRADLIAFPYRSIDSSGAFLSALGYGAAMVTSDAGQFGDLPAGTAARFAAGDTSGLTEALRPLIADVSVRRRLGEAAKAHERQIGSWAIAAEATEAAYVDALARAGRA